MARKTVSSGKRAKAGAGEPASVQRPALGRLSSDENAQQVLLENIPGCTFRALLDPLVVHLFISAHGEDLSGYPLTTLFDGTRPAFQSLCIAEDQEAVDAVFAQASRDLAPYAMSYRIRRADGELRWMKEVGRCFVSKGEPQVLATVYDVTGEQEVRQALLTEGLLLQATSEAMAGLVGAEDLMEALYKAAELVGRSTGVDRVYLFTNELAEDAGLEAELEVAWDLAERIPDEPGVLKEHAVFGVLEVEERFGVKISGHGRSGGRDRRERTLVERGASVSGGGSARETGEFRTEFRVFHQPALVGDGVA